MKRTVSVFSVFYVGFWRLNQISYTLHTGKCL